MVNDSLYAYIHVTQSQRVHLRVRQTFFVSATFADDMRQVGSPANWYPNTQEWDFPLTPAGVTVLQQVAEQHHVALEWAPELKEYAAQQLAVERYEEQVRLAIEKARRDNEALPSYVTNTVGGQKPPMFHQQLAYHWSLRSTGLLLAWEPGCGKTRGASDAAGGWYRSNLIQPMRHTWLPPLFDDHGREIEPARYGVEGGVLVVCPSGVMQTWEREMALWQGMTTVRLSGSSRKVKFKRAGMIAHAHIINYESLHIVVRNKYDAIIVDESHRCANRSQQTERVLLLSIPCKRRLLLTGTPVSNSLDSVFFQMLIVDGGRSLGPSRAAFERKYFTKSESFQARGKLDKRDDAEHEVAQRMSRATFFLKKTDALDLPPKLDTPILLEMTKDQRRYYEQLKKDSIAYIQDSTVTIDQAAGRVMKLLQVCQGVVRDDEGEWRKFTDIKTETMIDKLKNDMQGRKVVVWCLFTHEIDQLCRRLHEEGIGVLRYDGQVGHRDRDRIKDIWNNDPRYTVFVGQIQMGEGIELVAEHCSTPCFDCFYLGLSWRYIAWEQSQDRIHRITQRYPVHYTYFLTESGLDRSIYDSLLSKRALATTVHQTGKEYFLSLLTEDMSTLSLSA